MSKRVREMPEVQIKTLEPLVLEPKLEIIEPSSEFALARVDQTGTALAPRIEQAVQRLENHRWSDPGAREQALALVATVCHAAKNGLRAQAARAVDDLVDLFEVDTARAALNILQDAGWDDAKPFGFLPGVPTGAFRVEGGGWRWTVLPATQWEGDMPLGALERVTHLKRSGVVPQDLWVAFPDETTVGDVAREWLGKVARAVGQEVEALAEAAREAERRRRQGAERRAEERRKREEAQRRAQKRPKRRAAPGRRGAAAHTPAYTFSSWSPSVAPSVRPPYSAQPYKHRDPVLAVRFGRVLVEVARWE